VEKLKSGINEKRSSVKNISSNEACNDACPLAHGMIRCDYKCAWNQGDYCIMYDLRNDLHGIRVALEAIVKVMPA
jgi:hypothetical protein